MFGKITLNDLVFLHDPIVLGATLMMFLGVAAVIGLLTYYKKWTWLWTDWITTVDHKKIGTMYIIVAAIMLFRGFSDALLMRAQQAIAAGDTLGFLPPEHYDQIFTVHGVIMIFFVAMPFMFGLLNWIVPLQIGARDVAFPFLNSLSFWLFAVSAVLINISLFLGEFAATGWLAYPPLSGLVYSPGVGVDYYIWAIQISGIGSLLSGINFFVTIIKMRCPGMTLMRMPIFTWTALCAMVLVIVSFPVLTVTLAMLFLDRFFDMHFFTSDFGGNPMMYINLIWIWGHPEVYILVLPAFGIFSEVTATFCRKKLFGYGTMVWATIAITVLSFVVWLHHFFTMGAGANVNAFFGIATMIIAVPTGVKVFNWLFTMYRGRIHFTTPMLWTVGFIITFAIGGMTGVLMSVPPIDFQLHNSLFLVAHFHNVIVGGVLFGYFAGFIYWFPKFFGFKLSECLGKISFTAWIVGFFIAFMPLYWLGMLGASRRMSSYSDESWQIWFIVAAIGAVIIAIGISFQVLQLLIGFIKHDKAKDTNNTEDPWDARTLEWDTASPPAFYNFAIEPVVHDRDSFWEQKQNAIISKNRIYKDIHMPKNSSLGFIISVFAFFCGFGIIWHIYWLVFVGLLGCLVGVLCRSFDYNIDYYVKAEEVAKIESARNLGA